MNYLCKAKRLDNEQWVEGYCVFIKDEDRVEESALIFTSNVIIKDETKYLDFYEVDKDTLSKCTGLHDKKGNYIYENDILNIKDWGSKLWTVEYVTDGFYGKQMDCDNFVSLCDILMGEATVIGNIYDNPELMT